VAVSWKYNFLSPFSYRFYNFGTKLQVNINSYVLAAIYTLIILAGAYVLYVMKKDKG